MIVGKIYDEPDFNKGLRLPSKGQFTDMIAAGIIDPFKVVKNGLVDAAGVAPSLLATTECAIVDVPDPKPAAPAPGMGGMPGMGGF